MPKKECPPDKERYPLDTGNCLKKCKPSEYRHPTTRRCRVKKECPPGKEQFPSGIGNCLNKCPKGTTRHEITKRCRKITGSVPSSFSSSSLASTVKIPSTPSS